MTDGNSLRAPSGKTIKRLFALSGNRCAFPNCPVQLVAGGTIIGEVCHIRAAQPGGPRYDSTQSDEERHGYDNLILLCGNHHTEIDGDENTYSVQCLVNMKTAHESSSARTTDEDAESAAALLLAITRNAGIVAHTVHAKTINVHQTTTRTDSDNRVEAARGFFAPVLARIIARQVYVLGRIAPNFISTSVGKPPPGDTWSSLKPSRPFFHPSAVEFQHLPAEDATSLIEFYDSLQDVADTINGWVDAQQIATDVNAWNFLMQKVQNNLRVGQNAVRRFCPDRPYSAIMPAAGTLIQETERAISGAQAALMAHLARHGAI